MANFESAPDVKTELEKKQEVWNDKIKEIEEVEDRLGCPVDEGIKEAVIAFWVNNFPTRMSCEGHIEIENEVRNSPYVFIGLEPPEESYVGQEEIEKKIAEQMGVPLEEAKRMTDFAIARYNYIAENNVPETPEYIEITKKNEEFKKQITELLDVFYQDRETPPDDRLVITPLEAGSFALMPKKEEPDTEEELKVQQKEMQDFASLLKEKFFNS